LPADEELGEAALAAPRLEAETADHRSPCGATPRARSVFVQETVLETTFKNAEDDPVGIREIPVTVAAARAITIAVVVTIFSRRSRRRRERATIERSVASDAGTSERARRWESSPSSVVIGQLLAAFVRETSIHYLQSRDSALSRTDSRNFPAARSALVRRTTFDRARLPTSLVTTVGVDPTGVTRDT
jgi:hypothetical protein